MLDTQSLTPRGFPIWAESIRTQHISSESWLDRVKSMAVLLEREARQEKSEIPQGGARKRTKGGETARAR